jgi:hypothetical protein
MRQSLAYGRKCQHFGFLKSCPQSILKKSRKGLLLLLLLLPKLVLLLLLLLVAVEVVADAEEAVPEAGHWPSLLLRSEVEKKNVYLLPIHK